MIGGIICVAIILTLTGYAVKRGIIDYFAAAISQ